MEPDMYHAVLKSVDPEIYNAIELENKRQNDSLILIASENYVSQAVLAASASTMTNKYAEGYPGKRYYNGCEFVDMAESLAIERVKKLFDADAANVQPHSGAQANMAVFMAVMKPGDTYLGMDLAHGGHLSHGSPVNFSGLFFNVVSYGVDRKNHLINYDEVERLALEHRPKLIIAGASAYPRKIDFERFGAIAKKTGAKLMVDIAHIAGLVAAGEHQSPVPYADFVTLTTHKTLRGPRGGIILANSQNEKEANKYLFPGSQGGPLMNVIAAKAVSFKEAMEPGFKDYQKQVILNSRAMAETLMSRGLTLISGGTDNHLMLVDLRGQSLTGRDVANRLESAGITCNKNGIPFDEKPPVQTSGIRLGSPALTTRGLKEDDFRAIANSISDIIFNMNDDSILAKVKAKTAEICKAYPANNLRLS
jgi:glycine hydroxymethyltransferase